MLHHERGDSPMRRARLPRKRNAQGGRTSTSPQISQPRRRAGAGTNVELFLDTPETQRLHQHQHYTDPRQHTEQTKRPHPSGCQIRESGNGLPESTLCRGDQRSDNGFSPASR